jgi:calcineurin-like phosphoesterase family protein
MSRRFILSDTHFCHDNILHYTDRPFRDVDEMDNIMVERWNTVVSERDRVFHLGDFTLCNKARAKNIISQLNGDITLVLGNHDRRKTDSWWLDVGIGTVYRYPIIFEGIFIMSHEPVVHINETLPYINLHGHTHNKIIYSKQHINCCVEIDDYTPQNLDEIIGRVGVAQEGVI